MKKIIWLFFLLVILLFSKPLWEDSASEYVDLTFLAPVDEWVASLEIDQYVNVAKAYWMEIKDEPTVKVSSSEEVVIGRGVILDQISLGMKKSEIEKIHGTAQRVSLNEYDLVWHTYHENYENFIMVSYDSDNKVNAMFTNQPGNSSFLGIQMDSNRDEVHTSLGEPLTKLRKGNIVYILPESGEYDLFQMDDSYLTIFYDKHENNSVTGLQIMEKSVEKNHETTFGTPSVELTKGFELQLFDLTNAARVFRGLSILTYDEAVSNTARKHSEDMAIHNYFNHENLNGESPFDRLEKDGLTFSYAGENLAYGQASSIFAHEGLMNSLGHRENILNTDYNFLGVGTAFNKESAPYYTENFYAK